MHHWNYYTIANSNYYKSLSVGCLSSRLLWHHRSFSNTSGSKSETIVQCFVCHSISVFKFDLLHRRKRTYSQTHMCFHTSSTFLVRNISVWEIYLCWLISRSSLQQGSPTWCPGAPGRPQGPCRSPVKITITWSMSSPGFFLRKMLGTRYGSAGTRFFWF